MPIATLSEVLQPALKGSYAVGGLVTLGWEDMRAFVAAAEAENCLCYIASGTWLPRAYSITNTWKNVSLFSRKCICACSCAP